MLDEPKPSNAAPEPQDFERTLTIGGSSSSAAPPATDRKFTKIGNYRVIRLLGEGGMGAVYEAEQDQPRRKVAIKVLKTAFASPELVRRFEREFQTLGRLHHPGIGEIYEAGTADAGFGTQPFFAMEIVYGLPLVAYANTEKLNTRQRLALMIKICEAVEHAHQRGIIHRDLKPANILVNDLGQPKILDFGLARVTDGDMQMTRQTDMGQLVGTLAYMSPEQVTADPHALDTRSDVYALGVILYELLAGKLPYDVSRHMTEIVKTIQQVDPAKLSSVNRAYRGDIETIVAKALEKDKSRRYGSAAELAADIRRYLDDLPIAAQPPSATYQLQKFTRRNKALVVGAGVVLATLVVGVVISTWQAVRARRAERRAVSEAATAQAVADFLQKDLLSQASADVQASPNTRPDPDIKVRTALDRAAERIGGKFAKQPEVEASIRDTIGQTYLDLGLFPEARKQYERALELQREALGPENPATLKTIGFLAQIEEQQSQFTDAEALLVKNLEVERRILGPENPDTLFTLRHLGSVYWSEGKYAQAEAIDKQALDILRRLFGPESAELIPVLNNISLTYRAEGKLKQAEQTNVQTVEIARRVHGPEHPDALMAINNLANVYKQQLKYPEAEALYSQNFETYKRVLGPEHPDTLRAMGNVAGIYQAENKFPQAEAMYRQVVVLRSRVLGPDRQGTLYSMQGLADTLFAEGKYAQSEALEKRLIEARSRVLGPEHPDTVYSIVNLGSAYFWQGKFAQAEPLYNQALEIRRRVLGPEHPDTLDSMNFLAFLYRNTNRIPQADVLLNQILEINRRTRGADDPATAASLAAVADIDRTEGKLAEAEAGIRQVLDTRTRTLGADDPSTLEAAAAMAMVLADEKQAGKAEAILRDTLQRARQSKDQNMLAQVWYVLACEEAAQGKKDAAIEYLRKSDELSPQAGALLMLDPDLKELHGDPQFNAIIAKARARAASTDTSK
jgi:serine/threonine protein kinase/tetratricopeptide (TPR) repeat protein